MHKFLTVVTIAAMSLPLAAQDQSETSRSSAIGKPSAATESRPAPVLKSESGAPGGMALPTGTSVRMKLETPLNTVTNKRGDRFGGRLTQPVIMNGRTIMPVGSAIEGVVLETTNPRRISGLPTIELHPDTVTLPNGTRYTLAAVVVDTNYRPEMSVNDEGKIKGKGYDNKDLIETGAGTAGGALIGGLAGGGKGLLIGAGIGATATVVHWLTKHNSAELPAGTEIFMELSRPLSLVSMAEGQ